MGELEAASAPRSGENCVPESDFYTYSQNASQISQVSLEGAAGMEIAGVGLAAKWGHG